MIIWVILGIISAILLVMSFFKGQNAIWGGLTLGAVVGLILVIINRFSGNDLNWIIIAKAAIVGCLIGSIFELISHIMKK